MSTDYAGDPTLFPDELPVPDDGDDLDAASVVVGMEALADRTAHVMRAPMTAVTTSQDIEWTAGTVRIGAVGALITLVLIADGAAGTPPTGATVRFVRTLISAFTVVIRREDPALATIGTFAVVTAATDAAFLTVQWSGTKWQAVEFSGNFPCAISEV
jgi:hypothetical protein